MIAKNLSLVPFEPIQQAVSFAIAEVEKKIANGKKIAEYPYATAFFLQFFGKRVPTKNEVLSLIGGDLSVKEKTSLIDQFLSCNGSFYRNIDPSFAKRAFPSLAHISDQRFKSHFDLKKSQSSKVDVKIKSKVDSKKESLVKDLLSRDRLDIASWVSDTECEFANFEQVQALSEWFDLHCKHYEDKFNDLFYGMSAYEIAVDLSYG